MPRFRRIFNQFGITEQQWRILRVLDEGAARPVRQVAELTLIPAPSLVGVIDRLRKQGLVSREHCLEDRRRVLVRATPRGCELHDRIAPLVTRAYSDLMQGMPPRDWIRLIEGLDALARAAKPDDG